MNQRYQLTYIDMHPAPVKREPGGFWWVLACVVVFASWGVMLAWRG